MRFIKKIKTIDKNNGQNKAQYKLDRQTAKISVLSSRNVGKCKLLTDEDALLEKGALEKATAINLPLDSKQKKATEIAKKQYQGFNNVYQFDKKEDGEKMN